MGELPVFWGGGLGTLGGLGWFRAKPYGMTGFANKTIRHPFSLQRPKLTKEGSEDMFPIRHGCFVLKGRVLA